MVNAVYDHIVAILVICVMFVGAVVVLPTLSVANIKAVDQQQLRNIALNVFNTMLLDTGEPVNWGSLRPFYKNDPRVKKFGLASAEDSAFYVLDPDKVQRLVVGNPLNYCDYNRVRELLGLQGYGFRLRIVPPFNVTFKSLSVINNVLRFNASVNYLDGTPVPNAEACATVVYTKGKDYFNISQAGPIYSNPLGICEGTVNLAVSNPDYYTVVLRVTISNVATLVVTSGQNFENKIARVNVVYDTIVLTSWKDPPDYNVPPNENVWILDIVSFSSSGSIWYLFKGGKTGDDNKFNTGKGPFERWNRSFPGLHDFQPVIFVFNFWAVDQVTGHGRSQVLITLAYPNLLSTNVFEYGGIPQNSSAVVKIQRSVIISGMTYTAELWLWKESP
ncbi:hypothetical protein KEJ32_03460 [Candidatus Bathyarchaeota archaeon]|nr:hypothetical protein [Candidatus Bathyarchaeota archaeon]